MTLGDTKNYISFDSWEQKNQDMFRLKIRDRNWSRNVRGHFNIEYIIIQVQFHEAFIFLALLMQIALSNAEGTGF